MKRVLFQQILTSSLKRLPSPRPIKQYILSQQNHGIVQCDKNAWKNKILIQSKTKFVLSIYNGNGSPTTNDLIAAEQFYSYHFIISISKCQFNKRPFIGMEICFLWKGFYICPQRNSQFLKRIPMSNFYFFFSNN